MPAAEKLAWKQKYFDRMRGFIEKFDKVLVVSVDNIRSKQMMNMRRKMRDTCEILMGKNTMMRKCLRDLAIERGSVDEPDATLMELCECVKGNVGFVFTSMDSSECRDRLQEDKIQAPAKPGIVAPTDVYLEAGPTGMDAQKTSFFQALNLPTKIVKGDINILNKTHLVKEGDKVGMSEAKLLNMLGVSPFFYGFVLVQVMEGGSVFPPEVLDIKPEQILAKFGAGLANVAAIGLATGLPNKASAPHSILNGFKFIAAAAVGLEDLDALDIKIGKDRADHPGIANAKLFLKDPEAFAAANPGGGGGGGGGGDAAAEEKAAEPEPEEEEEESEEDMDMGLFD